MTSKVLPDAAPTHSPLMYDFVLRSDLSLSYRALSATAPRRDIGASARLQRMREDFDWWSKTYRRNSVAHCVCSCAKYREGDGVEAGSNGGAGGEGEDGPHGGFMVRGGEVAAALSAGESG